jgi:hypothetical protein
MVQIPKVIYAAMLSGALLMAGLLAFLRHASVPAATLPVDVLRAVALGMAVADLVGLTILRRRIVPATAGTDVGAWWKLNQGVVIVSWALAESLILVGAILYYLSGDLVPAAVAGLGVVLLLFASPGRLVE